MTNPMLLNQKKTVMHTHKKNISFQAEKHPLKLQNKMTSRRQYFEYLMHHKAYEVAAELARAWVVLDFGCNVGYGTKIISGSSNKAIGIDVSLRAIESAKKTYNFIYLMAIRRRLMTAALK